MSRATDRRSPTSEAAPQACLLAEAESDYYDCMARFGHNSAEAHVAERLWRKARSDRARTSGRRA